MQKNIRQSNFELLRIISIIMILGLHYNLETMGGAFSVLSKGDNNYYIAVFLESAFIISVNCFILITGYFMVNENTIKVRKIVDIISIVLFYNIFIYSFYAIFSSQKFSVKSFLLHAKQPKWFITIYIMLYVLTPYINKLINSINKKSFQKLLLISIIGFSIWPSIAINIDTTPTNDKGYGIVHFILIYMIGVYIRKYYNHNHNRKKYIVGYIFSTIIIFLVSLVTTKSWDYNFVVTIFSSVCFFFIFYELSFKSKVINYLSGFTLGIFIIHTDGVFVENIWRKMFGISKFCTGKFFIANFIFTILTVYLLCVIVEIIRSILFRKYLNNMFDKIKILNLRFKVE